MHSSRLEETALKIHFPINHSYSYRALWPGLYNNRPSPRTCSQYWRPKAQLLYHDFYPAIHFVD